MNRTKFAEVHLFKSDGEFDRKHSDITTRSYQSFDEQSRQIIQKDPRTRRIRFYVLSTAVIVFVLYIMYHGSRTGENSSNPNPSSVDDVQNLPGGTGQGKVKDQDDTDKKAEANILTQLLTVMTTSNGFQNEQVQRYAYHNPLLPYAYREALPTSAMAAPQAQLRLENYLCESSLICGSNSDTLHYKFNAATSISSANFTVWSDIGGKQCIWYSFPQAIFLPDQLCEGDGIDIPATEKSQGPFFELDRIAETTAPAAETLVFKADSVTYCDHIYNQGDFGAYESNGMFYIYGKLDATTNMVFYTFPRPIFFDVYDCDYVTRIQGVLAADGLEVATDTPTLHNCATKEWCYFYNEEPDSFLASQKADGTYDIYNSLTNCAFYTSDFPIMDPLNVTCPVNPTYVEVSQTPGPNTLCAAETICTKVAGKTSADLQAFILDDLNYAIFIPSDTCYLQLDTIPVYTAPSCP